MTIKLLTPLMNNFRVKHESDSVNYMLCEDLRFR